MCIVWQIERNSDAELDAFEQHLNARRDSSTGKLIGQVDHLKSRLTGLIWMAAVAKGLVGHFCTGRRTGRYNRRMSKPEVADHVRLRDRPCLAR